jgi:hypothetical protein
MDISQIQKEMERVQAEMMKIQTEYAANPTPENMAAMQQKIAALNQEMMNISMGMLASAGAGSFGIPIDPQGFEDMLNYDDEADKQAKRDFVAAHPVPAGQEKYLPIGAMLIATHDEPWQCFALMNDAEHWKHVLKEGWDIKKADAGREMLASLLVGRHEKRFGDEYRKFKAGQPYKLDEDSVEGYEEALESIAEDIPLLFPFAQKCNTLLAWDLERAGYLARIYRALGWIDDAELWDWLKKTADAIKAVFPVWEEYFASILVGRAVAFRFDYHVTATAQEVFSEGQEIFKKYPIKSL